ncbi:Ysc84 actin-binding domain [Phytophthora cactorum]|nr:Ysc84 actin-binding domain [Phytophthora cactorum]
MLVVDQVGPHNDVLNSARNSSGRGHSKTSLQQDMMMNSTHAAPQGQSHGLPRSKPSSVASSSSSIGSSHSSQRPPHPMRKPSTKALILQQKQHEDQQRATLARADTADDSMLSRAASETAPQLTAEEAAAALRDRSNSLAVMESMRSHLPGNGHTMSVKATTKLKKEMDNAAQVVETFLSPKLLKDQSIPHELLAEAYGLVFVTMYKVGFLFSGKIGTGFVISRTTGGWSAPSFLTSGGFGFGMMAGGEVVNYMVVLNSRSAVKVFTRNGQVQLGSELDIAVGPIGRAASASLNVGAGGVAPNYSYSHSKGLYGGIGLSGAVICTRKSLNAKCYGPIVTARQLLGGEVACPLAEPLWRALDKALGMQREYVNGFPVLAPTYTGFLYTDCIMEFGGAKFPTLTPRLSELYGASSGASRVGEADAYAQDLDELEREERALENMVQELVNRKAAVPIGVKFHREGAGNVAQQADAGTDSLRGGEVPLDSDTQFIRSSSSEEELEEDMDEDDSEEETTGRATIVRGVGQQRDEDSFDRDIESGDDSMEMEEELPPPSDWH